MAAEVQVSVGKSVRSEDKRGIVYLVLRSMQIVPRAERCVVGRWDLQRGFEYGLREGEQEGEG